MIVCHLNSEVVHELLLFNFGTAAQMIIAQGGPYGLAK